jgi:[ribosomal protein S5]-alanine N-acetyltransferase
MKILETERMIFRRLRSDDLDALAALYGDPQIRRYFPEGTLNRAETQKELDWFRNGHPDHPELGLWAAILKQTGAFIGRCGLLPWTIEGIDEIEIAYLIATPFQRQGLGAEAAQALVGHGFGTLGLQRLIALIEPVHEASTRTAMRAGLCFEKTVAINGVTSAVYAINRQTG